MQGGKQAERISWLWSGLAIKSPAKGMIVYMFFIGGISAKLKPQGIIGSCPCPVCGRPYTMHIIHKYMTPHVFFIPTFKFNSEYIATCESCASVMELSTEKGRALKKDPDTPVFFEDLKILQNNMRKVCSDCGESILPNQNFCPGCGKRL